MVNEDINYKFLIENKVLPTDVEKKINDAKKEQLSFLRSWDQELAESKAFEIYLLENVKTYLYSLLN